MDRIKFSATRFTSPFRLWRQLAVSAGASLVTALGSWFLIDTLLAPAAIDDAILSGQHTFLISYGVPAILAMLVFDGCWQTAQFGGSLKEVLRAPFRPRFWSFALAWLAIDAFFFSAWGVISAGGDVAQQIEKSGGGSAWLVVAMASTVISLALIFLRLRLVLWPVHVFATGRMFDLGTAWARSGGAIRIHVGPDHRHAFCRMPCFCG